MFCLWFFSKNRLSVSILLKKFPTSFRVLGSLSRDTNCSSSLRISRFWFIILNGLWIEGGCGAPHFFLLDEKSMKKLLNWKNLRDMWLNISSATYDTKIETRGRVEHIKHCVSSGEIRPPPFDPQYIVCVCTYKSHNNNNNTHFVNTTRIPTCINTVITTAVFNIY